MLAAYVFFFALGIATWLLLSRMAVPLRAGIALAVFLIPAVALTVWVLWVGDRPAPDSAVVSPEPPVRSDENGLRN